MHTSSPSPVTPSGSPAVIRWFRSHLITRDMARKHWLHARRTLQIDHVNSSQSPIQTSERRPLHRKLSKSDSNLASISENVSQTSIDLHRQRFNEWSETFSKVVMNNDARVVFLKFLESEHNEENILFWTAVEELHALSDRSAIRRTVAEINRTFIEVDSPLSINIDHETRQAIKMKMKDCQDLYEIEISIFDRAQMQIYHLMEKDCFGRFAQTDNYKQLASRMCLPTKLPWGGAGGR